MKTHKRKKKKTNWRNLRDFIVRGKLQVFFAMLEIAIVPHDCAECDNWRSLHGLCQTHNAVRNAVWRKVDNTFTWNCIKWATLKAAWSVFLVILSCGRRVWLQVLGNIQALHGWYQVFTLPRTKVSRFVDEILESFPCCHELFHHIRHETSLILQVCFCDVDCFLQSCDVLFHFFELFLKAEMHKTRTARFQRRSSNWLVWQYVWKSKITFKYLCLASAIFLAHSTAWVLWAWATANSFSRLSSAFCSSIAAFLSASASFRALSSSCSWNLNRKTWNCGKQIWCSSMTWF